MIQLTILFLCMLLIDGRNSGWNILVTKVWLNSLLNIEVHFVGYLYTTNIHFTNYVTINFFPLPITIMMVTLYLKKLMSFILEFDNIYGFINKVLYLCNENYRSESKLTQTDSIIVIRKMTETTGRHFRKTIPSTEEAQSFCLSAHTQKGR